MNDKSPIEIAIGQTNILIEDEVCKAVGRVGIHINKKELLKALKAYEFVEELTNYIAEYPDDDYMTMECLCRKLYKHDLIYWADGHWMPLKLAEQTEPQRECEKCKHFREEAEMYTHQCEFYFMECKFEPKGRQTRQTEPKDDDIFDYCTRCGMRILSKWYKTEPKGEE